VTNATKEIFRKDGYIEVTRRDIFSGAYTTDKHSGLVAWNIYPINHLITSVSEANNIALKKLIKKIREESSHFNGQSFVGELRQTIHGLRHPFESMRQKVYSHLNTLSKRKRDMLKYPPMQRPQAWRKVLADTWLETAFGLKPLMHDVKDIAESIARSLEEPRHRARLASRGQVLDKTVVVVPDYRDYGSVSFRLTTEQITKAGVNYSVGMEAVVEAASGSLERFTKVLGFTPENFIPALYEVMPWSWLIDYFSNLGDIIEAGCTDTSNVKWIVRSDLIKSVKTVKASVNLAETYAMWAQSTTVVTKINRAGPFSEVSHSSATLTRTLPISVGTPSFTFESPFGSLGKMANMLAVMSQFSGKDFDPSWAKQFDQASRSTRSYRR
jgi:hypothetical protein